MLEDDGTLVRRSLEGDKAAFSKLVEKYHKVVYNVAFRTLSDRDDAADVTQSVFIKAYEKLGSFNHQYKFFSWLYKIGVNESLNFLQQRRKLDSIDEQVLSKERNPEESYRSEELSQQIQDALMNLSLDHRVVIVLSHFQELSYKEIGFVLELPEKTVKSRLFTARQQLRDIMQREGIEL
jgi:RNA polymerase sigma-70 factor (ECF subfamily)